LLSADSARGFSRAGIGYEGPFRAGSCNARATSLFSLFLRLESMTIEGLKRTNFHVLFDTRLDIGSGILFDETQGRLSTSLHYASVGMTTSLWRDFQTRPARHYVRVSSGLRVDEDRPRRIESVALARNCSGDCARRQLSSRLIEILAEARPCEP
jgi:hypothetical protein